jgi:hypothetical protein
VPVIRIETSIPAIRSRGIVLTLLQTWPYAKVMKKRRAKILVLFGAFILVIAMFLSPNKAARRESGITERCTVHRFDSTTWHDSARTRYPEAVRGCMAKDLLARNDFREEPRGRVVALLGEPRPTSYFRQYDLVYWLGPESGLTGIDSEWLVFKLNASGRVTETRVVTD